MEFDYMNLVWAVLPALVGVLATAYVGWKAKVLNDGVQDWKDELVKLLDLVDDKIDEKAGK